MESSRSRSRFQRSLAVGTALALCISMTGEAQMPDPNMPQPQPQQSTKNRFKQLFAGTLEAVLQTTGVGLATGLASAMTGAIQNWFAKPANAQPVPAAPPTDMMGWTSSGGMPAAPAGDMNAMPPPMGMPAPSADMSAMNSMNSMNAMPTMPSAAPAAMPAMASMPAPEPSLYAGLAYEVQAIRNGQVMTVDPATHSFATGDRFVVMYRPSLPGQVGIYNVNPLGQEKLIDTVNVAAGELTRLGPYEFRANTGTETLRLILSPCRSDGLLAMTRDIVKVDESAMSTAMAPASGMPAATSNFLPDCSVVASRGERPQTRDIVKVDSEEGTMFALDPVSAQEIQAGSLTPRELTLTFQHR